MISMKNEVAVGERGLQIKVKGPCNLAFTTACIMCRRFITVYYSVYLRELILRIINASRIYNVIVQIIQIVINFFMTAHKFKSNTKFFNSCSEYRLHSEHRLITCLEEVYKR